MTDILENNQFMNGDGVRVEEIGNGAVWIHGESKQAQQYLLNSGEVCWISVERNGENLYNGLGEEEIPGSYDANSFKGHVFTRVGTKYGELFYLPEQIDVPLNWMIQSCDEHLVVLDGEDDQIRYNILTVSVIWYPDDEDEDGDGDGNEDEDWDGDGNEDEDGDGNEDKDGDGDEYNNHYENNRKRGYCRDRE